MIARALVETRYFSIISIWEVVVVDEESRIPFPSHVPDVMCNLLSIL